MFLIKRTFIAGSIMINSNLEAELQTLQDTNCYLKNQRSEYLTALKDVSISD